MDPFSITLGVVTLVTVASKVGIELKRLRNGAHEASTSINAMLADLKALKIVLESIEEGFEDLDGRAPLTGYIGAHWSALKTSLSDGCDSLDKLRAFLELTNKEVQLLDPIRRVIRLKEANEQIVTYRQEIQAYKDALQLSLQSVIFFQQTTIEDNTSKLLSSSHDLHEDLDRLAKSINVRLMALEMAFKGQSGSTGTGAASVEHLRDCVRTAATVVTSASTVLDEGNENAWDVTSEFGWLELNSSAQNDLTLDWIESQSTEQLDSQLVTGNNTSGEFRPSSTPPSATSAPPTTVVTRPVKSPENRHHEVENAVALAAGKGGGTERA
ncbi:hypothetical protein BCR34DRAFT_600219 [Clohesyomyces aquaticus]|uniref:Azaphilone pigments biosynthesis cluster protein L N-terminal domain-containing protein n=1 Tax=Clohesyomyces aquaticus TaxID=1231657 RepID=A0A1Y1ZRN3_9PLEO|nr:hypothetical protein BCR34DRAFT_600219 [Clohesyomyces aquaticus]